MRVPFVVAAVLFAGSQAAFAQQFQNQTSTKFPAAAVSPNEYTNQLTFVDLDADGDLDIVWANGQGYSSQGTALKPRMFINDGNAVFTDQTDARAPGITGWFRGAEAGDMDGDGDVDLILAQDFNKKPILLENTGGGNFINSSAKLPNINMSSARAQFGDVDNDGDLDLIFNNSGTTSRFGTNGRPRLFLNDGTGTYSDAPTTQTPQTNISEQMDIFFFDVDNDLDLDIYVGTRAGQSKLWLNDGTGVYTNLGAAMPGGGGSYSYDAGDIDGDGDLDLIGINSGSGTQELLLRNNNGIGTNWSTISAQISPNPNVDDNDSRFFDNDFDGDLDLIVGSLGSTERYYQNNGAGTFTQTSGVIPAASDASLDIKVADLNDDGRPDIVTGQGESGSFQNKIFINVTGNVDNRAPVIKLTEQVVPGSSAGPFAVRAQIFDDTANDRGYEFEANAVKLVYSVDGGASVEMPMTWVGAWNYRATLPKAPACSNVQYWVVATDRTGNVGTGPTKSYDVRGECGGNPADYNDDGVVDGQDLGILLGGWGTAETDLTGDGTTDGADLGVLLGAWGPTK
jgi:hypothetical protein